MFSTVKRSGFVVVVASVVAVLAVLSTLFVQRATAQANGSKELEGFKIAQIRFDESEGDKRPTPVIPKRWRLVAVSNGEKVNSNNLWFQDTDGTIYVVRGFTTYGKFVMDATIQKLEVGQ